MCLGEADTHPVIEVANVSYDYRAGGTPIAALRGVSLSIGEGEHIAVMGANGSGKTTLARCLNGLLTPTRGRVLVDGLAADRPETVWEVRRKVGMIFQNPDTQLVSTVVEREVAFGLENLGIPSQECHRRVDEALERFDLVRYRHHAPHLLSGGEKQRLAVASVWAMQPKYLVLDEPTALLDARGRHEVLDVLSELARDRHVTIVHITQSPEEAAQTGRVIVLDQGRVLLDGTPGEVFARDSALAAVGLEVPKVCRLAAQLRSEGVPVPGGILMEDALIAALVGLSAGPERRAAPRANEAPQTPSRPPERTAPACSPPVIETRGLHHLYHRGLPTQQLALSGVDLTVAPGEFLALVGSTGSGKTTLVQHFNGLIRATSGQVLVDGVDLWGGRADLQRVRRQIGLVFQFPELQLFEEEAAKDVAFGPVNLGLTPQQVECCVREAFGELELDFERLAHRSPFELSGGEQRRLAIAGVLAMLSAVPKAGGRSVLVLDEPTAGLDGRGARQIRCILERLNAAGRAIILICHDMDLVAQVAPRAVGLHQGRVRFDGDLREAVRGRLLEGIGLDAPWAARMARGLGEAGLADLADALTVEELSEAVAEALIIP